MRKMRGFEYQLTEEGSLLLHVHVLVVVRPLGALPLVLLLSGKKKL